MLIVQLISFTGLLIECDLTALQRHCASQSSSQSVLPVPGYADDSVAGDGVVAGDDEVVAVGEVADGGGALQQPRAALRHLPARQAVVTLNLNVIRSKRVKRGYDMA